MKFIFSENVKDVVFGIQMFDDAGKFIGAYNGMRLDDLGKIIDILSKDYGKLRFKKNFWKGFAIGSFALWFYYDIKNQKKISELKLENEVLRDALPEEVDDGHDEA